MAAGLTDKAEASMSVSLSPTLSRKRARGMRSDGTASHSTMPSKNAGQVAGYRFASFTLCTWLRRCWQAIRQLSGDDAYERYLAHRAACHADAVPLSRAEYFRRREREKWEGVRRCC
jgi:uncharacterized short protein YbdD (DUF466 family)